MFNMPYIKEELEKIQVLYSYNIGNESHTFLAVVGIPPPSPPLVNQHRRFNMEFDLQSLFGLLCTGVLFGWDPATPPLPRIWALIRGRYRSAKIDDISL